MKKSLSFLLDGCIAVLLGIILTFAFAPYEIFPLAVLAPAGLLILWLKVSPSPKKAFWLGFMFGLGLFGSGVYWVFISIHVVGDVPIALASFITVGLIAFLALYPAMAGYLLNRYFPMQTTQKLIYAFPTIWVFLEWVRGLLFSGFPWLFLGYSQTNSPLKGYAPILSVYGISLALTMSSGLLVNAGIRYKQKDFKAVYQNLFTLTIIWIIGGMCSFIPWTIPQAKPLTVALVQGNIPQTIKWSPEHLQYSLDTYTELTKPLWGKSDIIIWPEAAVPLPLQNAADFINELDTKAQDSNTTLILGIPIRTPDEKSYFNSIITLGKDRTVYSKRHLVPFGEYTPLSGIFTNLLKFWDIPMSEMEAGRIDQAPLLVNNTKILPSICYEIAFPDLTRSRDKSIGMLLVLTNDAWFGHSNAEPQHLQMAAMRALEFHKPVIFVSNDGITAIINPNGQIIASAPQRQAAVVRGTIQPMYGITPWLNNGMDPLLFIFLAFIIGARLANNKVASLATQDTSQHTLTTQTETNN